MSTGLSWVPSRWASRPRATRPASASRSARRRASRSCSPTRSPPASDEHARFGGVVPEVASRAHLEAMAPAVTGRSRRANLAPAGAGRDRRHRRPGPGRRPARRGGRRQGLRGCLGPAALRRQPPGWRTSRSTPSSTARCRPAWRCSSRAATPACSTCRTWPADASSSRRHDRRRGGRGFDKVARLLGLAVPWRSAHRPAGADGDPAAIAFPRGLTGPRDTSPPVGARLLLLRVEDRGRPARGGAGAGRHAGADRRRRARRSRRRSSTCSPPRRSARPASAGWTRCCSAAGWRPTRGCGRWPSSAAPRPGCGCGCPRPGLCTDNGVMVAALGAHLVAAGLPPSSLELPADSGMPVTDVLVAG